jgi:16S rRNA (guanine527-N7)-methyltransferase
VSIRQQFISAVAANQIEFGLELSAEVTETLADYFELVQKDNSLLHLVAPCTPEEFAVRHVLESLTILEHLPIVARFADVGTGAGLPAIPCVLAREDLHGTLIESKAKKADFLLRAAESLNISSRVEVINRQFDEVMERDSQFVSCRALDRFVERVPRLLKWIGNRTFLFFGGPSLREALELNHADFRSQLMPMSEQRFLFVGTRRDRTRKRR